MFKKIICLTLSLVIFQIQAGTLSERDLEFSKYLKENNTQVEQLVNNLPQEAKEEILALENLSPEESQPIITDIFNHYSKETGANYNDTYYWSDEHTYILVLSLLYLALLVRKDKKKSDCHAHTAVVAGVYGYSHHCH